MKISPCVATICLLFVITSLQSQAEPKYIRQGASGSGSSWADAYGSFGEAGLNSSSDSSIRGNTYYVADGNYGNITFSNPTSGSDWIIIKKATIADHGTSTGWQDSYGDGQAVLGSALDFYTSYIQLDGNGTHTIPSNNTNDYGFKVSHDASDSWIGIVRFGSYSATVSNITLKYVHVYNTTTGDINNGTVGLRYYPGPSQTYIKVQNCFLENSGKDGIQISASSFLLFERNYVKRYGKLEGGGSPDVHGQTVQIFYGGDDIIFRYNYWEANEGQGLIQIAGINTRTYRVRFYGNVVFNKYGQTSAASGGFNSSGGLIGDAWYYNGQDEVYIYNNTFVNIGGDYGGHAHFPMNSGTNEYGYNNLFYNCGGNVGASGFTAWDYHASGNSDNIYGGANEQIGLTSNIFQNYSANDFRLGFGTEPGIDLTSQGWWDTTDSFFGYLDSDLDIYGNIRGLDGIWDRGAFEKNESLPSAPESPSNIRLLN